MRKLIQNEIKKEIYNTHKQSHLKRRINIKQVLEYIQTYNCQ